MIDVCHYNKPARDILDEPAATLSQQQWQLYHEFVDNNYFYYREVYGQVHRILVGQAVQAFRFLNIARGDARATVETLEGTRVAQYYGVGKAAGMSLVG
jgi:hypothetical protein